MAATSTAMPTRSMPRQDVDQRKLDLREQRCTACLFELGVQVHRQVEDRPRAHHRGLRLGLAVGAEVQQTLPARLGVVAKLAREMA